MPPASRLSHPQKEGALQMSRGNITRRGKRSWRLKFECGVDPATGQRQTAFVTVRGSRLDAQQELTRRLAAVDSGTHVAATKTTVAEWLEQWLEGQHGLAGKTKERYRELIERQITPHLGEILLQKLRPAQVQSWHATLLSAGGRNGRALSARTVGHAHRVLRKALSDALRLESVARNVAAVVAQPKVEPGEVEILASAQIEEVRSRLRGNVLYSISMLAVASGARRGELLAVRWADLDLDGSKLRVERSLEETKAGLRFKSPKTKHGRRTITLPASAVDVLRDHRRQQLELRLALGLGKMPDDALVFCQPGGAPMSPDNLSRDWSRTCRRLGLPSVSFHALRHTHASALIAAGLDVLTISRRLGHAKPTTTLNTYGHLFKQTDSAAAEAIEAAMGTSRGTK
jgi:integrase